MGSLDPRMMDENFARQNGYEPIVPKAEPAAPASELDQLLAKAKTGIEARFPGFHFEPIPDGVKIPGQPAPGQSFREIDSDPDEELPPGEEVASNVDYEKIFANRGKFHDSFDYVYDRDGRIIGTIVPNDDYERDQQREGRAIDFAENFMARLEKRIGTSIEQADTSELKHREEGFLERGVRKLFPKKRHEIHDPDELI